MENITLSLNDELYLRVEEVLHYIWDPIGVAGAPMARDEYHAYIPRIIQLLKENAERQKIIDCLSIIATKDMGLADNPKTDKRTANVLLDWKNVIFKKHGCR